MFDRSRGTIISADTSGSDFPTEVSLWEGQCGSLFELTSAASSVTIPPAPPAITWTVADTNSTYYIVAEGQGEQHRPTLSRMLTPGLVIGFAPASLDFGAAYPYTSPSPPLIVTYTNGSTVAVNVNSITLTGNNPGDFQIVANTCALSYECRRVASVRSSWRFNQRRHGIANGRVATFVGRDRRLAVVAVERLRLAGDAVVLCQRGESGLW